MKSEIGSWNALYAWARARAKAVTTRSASAEAMETFRTCGSEVVSPNHLRLKKHTHKQKIRKPNYDCEQKHKDKLVRREGGSE